MVEPYKPLYTVKEVAKILKTNTDFCIWNGEPEDASGVKAGGDKSTRKRFGEVH